MSRYAIIVSAVLVASAASTAFAGDAPIGSVMAWLKDTPMVPALPDGWVECNGQLLSDVNSPLNGQTIPALNGSNDGNKRLLRGSSTSGTTGGSSTIQSVSFPQGPVGGFWYQPGGSYSGVPSGIVLNPFYEVVWIMKVRESLEGVPAVGTWGLLVMGLLVISGATILIARRKPMVA